MNDDERKEWVAKYRARVRRRREERRARAEEGVL